MPCPTHPTTTDFPIPSPVEARIDAKKKSQHLHPQSRAATGGAAACVNRVTQLRSQLALFIAALALTTTASVPCASSVEATPDIPGAWRLPNNEERGDSWRQSSETKFISAAGDFDGDGVPDHAFLLVSRKDARVGLFITRSSGQKGRPVLVHKESSPQLTPAMGIAVVRPGKYRTACGKGYWACAKGEPAEIDLKHDAVAYYKYEGAMSYFYLDGASKEFRRIWISD